MAASSPERSPRRRGPTPRCSACESSPSTTTWRCPSPDSTSPTATSTVLPFLYVPCTEDLLHNIEKLDGPSDENQEVPQEDGKYKINRRRAGLPSYSSPQSSSKASKCGGNELLWSSLPLSIKKRSDINVDGHVKTSSGGAMPTEKEPRASFMSRTGKNSHATTDNTDRESFC